MISRDKLKSILEEVTSERIEWIENTNPPTIQLKKDNILLICTQLWSNSQTYFDHLSCITGLDNGPETGTMEVFYTLYSIPFNQSLMLKVELPRENPEIESVASIWQSANWLEREIFDLYGIHFTNHPDLRRILMPGDWEGFPLRKDYQEPETYRGIPTQENQK